MSSRQKIAKNAHLDSITVTNDQQPLAPIGDVVNGLLISGAAGGVHGSFSGSGTGDANPFSIHERAHADIEIQKNVADNAPALIKLKPNYTGNPTTGAISLESWYGDSPAGALKGAPSTAQRNHATFCIKQRMTTPGVLSSYGASALGWHTALAIDFDGEHYTNSMYPFVNNQYSLGNSTLSWAEIYAINTSVQVSDREKKTDIKDLKLGLDFVEALTPVSYKWKETQGRAGERSHAGLIAQDVWSVLSRMDPSSCSVDDRGLLRSDHSMFVSEWTGKPNEEGERPEKHYALRYGEMIPCLMQAIKELSARVKELEGKSGDAAAAAATGSKRKRTT